MSDSTKAVSRICQIGACNADALTLAVALWAQDFQRAMFVLPDETGLEPMAGALRGFAPDCVVLPFPAWDSLPYDRAQPSRAVTGARVATLAFLAQQRGGRAIMLTTPGALVQRVPPRERLAERFVAIRSGQPVDPEWLRITLEAFGYRFDELVDEPGEAVIRGGAIDVFPAGFSCPARLEVADERIEAIRFFDALTQRSTAETDEIVLLPASEAFAVPGEDVPQSGRRIADRLLPEGRLETIFDYLPDAAIGFAEGARERVADVLALVQDAYDSVQIARGSSEPVPAPERLYLRQDEIAPYLPAPGSEVVEPAAAEPVAAIQAASMAALGRVVHERLNEGDAVIVCGADPAAIRRGLARRLGADLEALESWQAALDLPRGRPGLVQLALTQGFRLDGRSVLAAPASVKAERNADAVERLLAHLRTGDLVVEPEHGLARLTGLTIEEQAGTREYIALGFLAGAQQLIPAEDVGSIWRYGVASSISPGRLDSSAWLERRRQVEQEIAAAAHALVQRLRARENARAAIIETGPDYQRFVRRVPFALSPGQADAIRAVLHDMRRGRPMHRLICGDVGFGKTEVALHAAAAAVFAGRQVAVAAPTTLLARQHLETFRRRLPGVRVEPMIRSSRSAESRQILAAARSGEAKVLIGTHAVAAAHFHDLGLVIIDEEQRFGEAQKRRLRSLGPEAHTLVMTATPLPRSLQTTLVGLIDASVLGDPPAGRQPVRGFVVPFDPAVIRAALMREARRGGQSFVVCPRIEDIAPLEAGLLGLVPDLSVAVAHGRVRGDELDRVMLEFANGKHDVLLATSIVEAGLDVPNANTIIVCQADRFGLAQLHQLRGRVGRGRVRASAYFMTDPERKVPSGARKRLEAIASLDALGAGFAVSAADLDQRGAGDLLGDEQSGHVRLIGTELYRHVLTRELARARGEAPDDEWTPEITLDVPAYVPRDLVPEADLRLEIYRRLARLGSDQEVEKAADELEDRFGDLPQPLLALLDLVRLRVLCRALGIAAVSAGPDAVAVLPRGRKLAFRCSGARVKGERVILPIAEPEPPRRLQRILAVLRAERSSSGDRASDRSDGPIRATAGSRQRFR